MTNKKGDNKSANITVNSIILTIFLGWSYIIGRFYKQWFYSNFNVGFDNLNIDIQNYMFSSYSTYLCYLSIVIISWCAYTSICHRRVFFIILSMFDFALLIYLFFFWPISFNPRGLALIKILGSRDVMLWAIGLYCLFLKLPLLIDISYNKNIFKYIETSYENVKKNVRTTIVIIIVTTISTIVIAFFEGNYQANAAIDEGKMNIKNVIIDHKEYHYMEIDKMRIVYDPIAYKRVIIGESVVLDILPYKRLR